MNQNGNGTILGHPKGLFVLFFTEMWERFSYYGMRALLVLYLVNYFKKTQEEASQVYKLYTSLVYLTPILGGYLADRYLGNKWTIIIGGIMMAIGQFLLTVDNIGIFYVALGFLIVGNGFFKPNMSVQVGRLYPANDPRRDGAYTIFYMGINLGAFLSPLVCGTLKDTPGLGYHWGFAAAGVGMVLGVVTYIAGLRWVKELPPGAVYVDPDAKPSTGNAKPAEQIMTETEAETAPSAAPGFAKSSPAMFTVLGIIAVVAAPILWWTGQLKWDNAGAVGIAGVSLFVAAWILSHLSLAVRDRVLAVYVLMVFVIFFWGAFEQAGNAMNVWADQTTNRYLTQPPVEPPIYPDAFVDAKELGFGATLRAAISNLLTFNPILTTSFQSINAAAIVVLAPIFAWLWLFLARRHVNLSIAAKMSMGVFFQGVAFALMIWAAGYEGGASNAALDKLPVGVIAKDNQTLHFIDAPDFDPTDDKKLMEHREGKIAESMIAHGGRMIFDSTGRKLNITGVLDANHRDRILRATVPHPYIAQVWELTKKSIEAKKAADGRGEKEFFVEAALPEMPAGFEPRYFAGFDPKKFSFDVARKTFRVGTELADKDYKQILVAFSDPAMRGALNDLYLQSSKYRVSSWWLFWFYVLCTVGELCLSPVGLSMVSKLAPRRFATMLMGMWLLTSFFGNYSAGMAGENWETLDPKTYFLYVTVAMVAASILCYLLARKVTSMMHGVK